MGTIKTYVAGGEIPAYRVGAFGTDDKTSKLATSQSDLIIGISDSLDSKEGDTVDFAVAGLTEIQCAETIPAGSDISYDDEGKAVVAGEGMKVIGRILKTGAADAVVPCVLK